MSYENFVLSFSLPERTRNITRNLSRLPDLRFRNLNISNVELYPLHHKFSTPASILEIPSSSLRWEAGCPDWGFHRLPQFLQAIPRQNLNQAVAIYLHFFYNSSFTNQPLIRHNVI